MPDYTIGPYEIHPGHTPHELVVGPERGNHSYLPIATVRELHSQEQLHADATLLAASWTLLQMCKQALAEIQGAGSIGPNNEVPLALMEELKNTIDLAEGNS